MANVIRLHFADNVVVAATDIPRGAHIDTENISAPTNLPRGHKIATAAIAQGAAVVKYGHIIGFATENIAPGEHVHSHNLVFGEFERDYAFSQGALPTDYVPEAEHASFEGYLRADGRVGTRNFVGVLASVNCSNSVAQLIANAFGAEKMTEFPHVDGVVALPHQTGCCIPLDGDTHNNLERTLVGYARHPNFAGVLIVGLGCEVAQIDDMLARYGLAEGDRLRRLIIQDTGGTRATVAAGIAAVQELLARPGTPPHLPRRRLDPGSGMRRFGCLFRHHRQSGAGSRGG